MNILKGYIFKNYANNCFSWYFHLLLASIDNTHLKQLLQWYLPKSNFSISIILSTCFTDILLEGWMPPSLPFILYSIIYLHQYGLSDNYFILWAIIHYYYYLFFCSDSSRFGHGGGEQKSLRVSQLPLRKPKATWGL